MKVKLNIDYEVMVDGVNLKKFTAGTVTDFPEHIARTLLADGRAASVATPMAEHKAVTAAPANKMAPAAPEIAATPPAAPAQTDIVSPELRNASRASKRRPRNR